MSDDRILHLDIHIMSQSPTKGILASLRRPINQPEYLTVLDCGKVPINNLDPVVRVCCLKIAIFIFSCNITLKITNIKQNISHKLFY